MARLTALRPRLRSLEPTHAPCPESVAFSQSVLAMPYPSASVFDCVGNLGCLVHWWPGALSIIALPPGVYFAGDVAVIALQRQSVAVRVIAYKPERRIVLSLSQDEGQLLVDLRVRPSATGSVLTLSLETARATGPLSYFFQCRRLRRLCRTAAEQLAQHLRSSPVIAGSMMGLREGLSTRVA